MSNAPARQRTAGMIRLFGLSILALLAPSVPAQDKPVEGKPFVEMIPGTTVNFNLVPIPAGKFMMGSPETEKKRKADEGPQFQVEVDGFWMGSCPVTQAEYNLFLDNYSRLAGVGAP